MHKLYDNYTELRMRVKLWVNLKEDIRGVTSRLMTTDLEINNV